MPDSHPIFQTFLQPGEKIIWSGKPRQGLLLHRSDVFFIPFSLVWTVIAVWMEFDTLTSPLPIQEKLWSLFSLAVAAYILAFRFLVDAAYRYLAYYALTNQRILIHTGLLKTTLTSLPLASQKEIYLDLRENGTGDIVFGPLDPKSWMYTGGGWPRMGKMARIPAFELLENPQPVYKKIREQRKRVK